MYNIKVINKNDLAFPDDKHSISDFINEIKKKYDYPYDNYLLINDGYIINEEYLNSIKDKLNKYYNSEPLPDVLIGTHRFMSNYYRSNRDLDRVLYERYRTCDIMINTKYWNKFNANPSINYCTEHGLSIIYLLLLAKTKNWLYIDNYIDDLHKIYCISEDTNNVVIGMNLALSYLLKDNKDRKNLLKNYLSGIDYD